MKYLLQFTTGTLNPWRRKNTSYAWSRKMKDFDPFEILNFPSKVIIKTKDLGKIRIKKNIVTTKELTSFNKRSVTPNGAEALG